MSTRWRLAEAARAAPTAPPTAIAGDLRLRSPRMEDVGSLQAFLAEHGREGRRYSTAAIVEQLRRGADLIWLAESGKDGLHGLAWGSYDHRRGWIHDVVAADSPGGCCDGLKKTLVEAVENELMARDCCRVNWFVTPRSGEVAVASSIGYRWPPPRFLMERPLSEGPVLETDRSLPALRLRLYEDGDQGGLVELWQSVGLAISAGDTPSGLRHKMKRDPELFLVATTGDGTIVASLLGSNDFPEGWISHLAVAPSWQGQGVGTHLVATASTRMRALGCSAVRLWVRPEREAVGFYRQLGFVSIPFLAVRKDLPGSSD